MIKCEGGEIRYTGRNLELISDVATIVYAVRDIIAKDIPEQKREQFCQEYELVVLSALAAPCGEEQAKAANIIRTVLKESNKNP